MRFAKLHGAGNDFILFDGGAQPGLQESLPALVARLCHRRLGIGADGVLLVTPTTEREARIVYWNTDGSPADFCANGTRCAARFAAERWGWQEMVLHTGFAAVPAHVKGGSVTLHLPSPSAVYEWRELVAAGRAVRARYLVLGVPHLVVPVDWDDFWRRELAPLAPALRGHAELPAGGANVNFVRREGDGGLSVRSWERGVEGETLSCGSGDAAVGLVALAEGWVAGTAPVRTASGRLLTVAAEGSPPGCPSRLAGSAEWVAEGTVSEELLAAPPQR